MKTDVAIVGGGIAGSTLMAMLGRTGVDAVLIDPHQNYPADFRCEKFDSSQIEILQKTGLSGLVMNALTPVEDVWVARYGRLLDKKPNKQCGFMYQTAVNAIRHAIPDHRRIVVGKAKAISTSDNVQTITLSNGKTVQSRLLVLANGLNQNLRRSLGIEKVMLSANHSVSIGFDLLPQGAGFDFPALTYFAERAADNAAYLTLFPIGSAMRANLFVYRQMDDPWLARMRQAPAAGLAELMPGLKDLTGGYDIVDDVKIRPVDLCTVAGYRQAGVVLVGDAFTTSCPAAGTGAGRALTDVELLANRHIPQWLANPGTGINKVAEFYDDREKIAYDKMCLDKAFGLRDLSTEPGPIWLARRLARFAAHRGLGKLRELRGAVPPGNGRGRAAPAKAGPRSPR